MPVIPAFGRLSQEDHEIRGSMGMFQSKMVGEREKERAQALDMTTTAQYTD